MVEIKNMRKEIDLKIKTNGTAWLERPKLIYNVAGIDVEDVEIVKVSPYESPRLREVEENNVEEVVNDIMKEFEMMEKGEREYWRVVKKIIELLEENGISVYPEVIPY